MAATTNQQEPAVADLGALLDAGEGAVVSLVAGETRLAAHRAVLAAGSPVFAAMFSHDMREASSGEVAIPDVEGPVLRQLVAFFYSGRAPQLPAMAPLLLAAADKYGVAALRESCEQQVLDQLALENAAATAVLALRHSCHSLRQAAIAFIKDNNFDVMATQGWAEAVRNHPEDVVDFTRLLAERGPHASAAASRTNPAAAAAPRPDSPPPDDEAISRFRRLSGEQKGRRLLQTAEEGAEQEVRALLAAGAEVGARDGGRWTALQRAAVWGHVGVAQCLLRAGAEVDASDTRWQSTALHWAAGNGRTAVVRLLLASSADVGARNSNGQTPLHWAAINGHTDAAVALIEAGADRGATDNEGNTPLHLARQRNHHSLIQMLQ